MSLNTVHNSLPRPISSLLSGPMTFNKVSVVAIGILVFALARKVYQQTQIITELQKTLQQEAIKVDQQTQIITEFQKTLQQKAIKVIPWRLTHCWFFLKGLLTKCQPSKIYADKVVVINNWDLPPEMSSDIRLKVLKNAGIKEELLENLGQRDPNSEPLLYLWRGDKSIKLMLFCFDEPRNYDWLTATLDGSKCKQILLLSNNSPPGYVSPHGAAMKKLQIFRPAQYADFEKALQQDPLG